MEQSAAVRSELSRLRVFISFSKPKSKILAEALKEWLPRVLQSADPLISESIDKGSAWPEGLDEKLKAAEVGIFCLTSENLYQPWIHFEAGALYMKLGLQRVCPYLLDVDYSEVPWPLARFQAARTTKAETRKLLATVNAALGESRLKDAVLEETFEMWWPRLEERIKAAQELPTEAKAERRDSEEILEEVVSLARSQSRQIENLEDTVSQLVAYSQYGIVTFAPGVGVGTPADLQHLRFAGKAAIARFIPAAEVSAETASKVPPIVQRAVEESRRASDVTPGTSDRDQGETRSEVR